MANGRKTVTIARSALLAMTLVAVLTVAPDAPAGGISDETCPNFAGEHTNTCPAGTVGVPYSIRFTEREGSGLRTRPTDVPLRLGDSPTGDDAYTRRHPERHVVSTWELPVLRGDARAGRRPCQLRREANSEAVHAQDPAAALDRLVSRRHASVGGGSALPFGSTSPRRLRHLRVVARLGPPPRGTQALC